MPERLRVLNTDAARVQSALQRHARPYPFGGSKERKWISLLMVDAWWPVLERAVNDLDAGRVPRPLGAKRDLMAPHQVLRHDPSSGETFTWSPGDEERERHEAYLEEHDDASGVVMKARPGPHGSALDVMLALYSYAWLNNDQTARDMLEQWLDELGVA